MAQFIEVEVTSLSFFHGRRVRPGMTITVPVGTKGKWFRPTGRVSEQGPPDPTRRARGRAPWFPRVLAEDVRQPHEGPRATDRVYEAKLPEAPAAPAAPPAPAPAASEAAPAPAPADELDF